MFPLKPYNDFKPTSNWNTYWYAQNVFNDQMINDLTQMVESNYKFEKGRTGTRELGTDTDSYDTNNRDIADRFLSGDGSLETEGLLTKLRSDVLEMVSVDSPKYPALSLARKKWTGKD